MHASLLGICDGIKNVALFSNKKLTWRAIFSENWVVSCVLYKLIKFQFNFFIKSQVLYHVMHKNILFLVYKRNKILVYMLSKFDSNMMMCFIFFKFRLLLDLFLPNVKTYLETLVSLEACSMGMTCWERERCKVLILQW